MESDALFAEAERLYRAGSYQDAFRIYMVLANGGRIGCQRFIGWMYFCGEGVERNLEQAYAWFSRAADQGDREAIFGAGRTCLLMSRHAEALEWFSRGCALDFAPACFRLGWMYEHGKGCQRDPAVAFGYLQKAYQGGNLPAGREIALLLMRGLRGVWGRIYGIIFFVKVGTEVIVTAYKDRNSKRLMD
jgi:uncharacterized protein